MKRLTTLSIALALAACADNRSSIEIDGRAAPSDATTCKFSAGGEKLLGPGLLDVAPSVSGAPNYALVVYVKNNLIDPATLNPSSGTIPGALTAAKAWTANSARVRLNPGDYTGTYRPNPALLSVSGEERIPLDGQATLPNESSTQYVEAVSAPLAAQLASVVTTPTPQRIVVGITLEGRTYDGASLDTGEWFFPIDVCNGCLAPVSQCATGQVLRSTNCFGPWQDSAPACSAQ